MNYIIMAAKALDFLCDLVLTATHHDKTPEEIEKLISDIRADIKPFHEDTILPPPAKCQENESA